MLREREYSDVRIRVVAYNVLNGGTGRADPLIEVVVAQRERGGADVVVLAEASDPEVVERMGRRLGMEWIIGASDRGKGGAVAVLTRGKVVRSVNHAAVGGEDMPRGLLEAAVEVAGVELVVFGVHLHARATLADEAVRVKEVGAVLRAAERYRAAGKAHVLAGDFNANSPAQVIDLAECKKATREAAAGQGGVIPRQAVELIERAGYVDSLLAFDRKLGERETTFSTREPGQRVDYVFAHGARVVSAWVEKDRLAQFASDHYPVGAEVEVPGG